jgi:hypothetical protein
MVSSLALFRLQAAAAAAAAEEEEEVTTPSSNHQTSVQRLGWDMLVCMLLFAGHASAQLLGLQWSTSQCSMLQS